MIDGVPEETTSAPARVIRPGRRSRGYLLALGTAWCTLGLIIFAVAVVSRPLVAVFPGLFLVVGGTFFYRLLRLSVRLDEDALIVCNYLKTRCVPKACVIRFRIGNPSLAGTSMDAVVADLRDGRTVSLDATVCMHARGGTRRLASCLQELTAWLG